MPNANQKTMCRVCTEYNITCKNKLCLPLYIFSDLFSSFVPLKILDVFWMTLIFKWRRIFFISDTWYKTINLFYYLRKNCMLFIRTFYWTTREGIQLFVQTVYVHIDVGRFQ